MDNFDPDSELGDEYEQEQEKIFPDAISFFENFLAELYPTSLFRENERNWTGNWWKYPHAVTRVEAMHAKFEYLVREEPETYLDSFLRCADYHMTRLLADGALFSDAKREDVEAIPLTHNSPQEMTNNE